MAGTVMAPGDLPVGLWVRAHLRRLSAQGTPVYITRRGPEDSGTVLLKLNRLQAGCSVYSQARDPEGRPGWLAAFDGQAVPEAEADAYVARAVGRDPDLWVIEIEDRTGGFPFDGPIL